MKERLTIDQAKREFIGNTYNYLTITDIVQYYDKYGRKRGYAAICKCLCGGTCTIKLNNVLSGHTHSCGCYRRSEESKEKYYSWMNSNKQAVKLMREHRAKTIADNNIQSVINKKNSIISANKRTLIDMSNVIELIHPDDLALFIKGAIRINDKIRTKCPVCSNYELHTFSKVFKVTDNSCKCKNLSVCKKCTKLVSCQEDEVESFISTFYSGECIRNIRSIISPLELDLYYPEKKIAIEFNGDYWHSDKHKSKRYHYEKYVKCRNNGVLLVSIFESAWNDCRDKIENYLYDLFNDKENQLSFNEDYSLMNNNYPSPLLNNLNNSKLLEDSYLSGKCHVFTCGYTILK
jgi:hypothetical protein